MDGTSIRTLLDSVATSIDQAHAAQVAALSALRELLEHREAEALNWGATPGMPAQLDDDLPAGKGVFTVSEVAKIMRVSDSNVYEMVHQGVIPSMRWGRQIRISRRGLAAFMGGMSANDFERLIRETVEKALRDTPL